MSDLRNDRPSTTQFKDKLPWFLSSLPSADCAKAAMYFLYLYVYGFNISELNVLRLDCQNLYCQLMDRKHLTSLSLIMKMHIYNYLRRKSSQSHCYSHCNVELDK
ncbi:hypothetical protein AHAS_Ahas15G0177800 [Arachis hypogaea]